MVGDGAHDIEAAAAAGVLSIWISHRSPRRFDAVPDETIDSLDALLPMLVKMRDSPDATGRVKNAMKTGLKLHEDGTEPQGQG